MAVPAAQDRKAGEPTDRGRQTRDRIVVAAADLMHRHGVAGTSTPAVRAAAGVSSSQIYHYFTDKSALTRAVIGYQSDVILSGQQPLLARLDSLAALRAWRDSVVEFQRASQGRGGCPLGSLASELSDVDPEARVAAVAGFARWSGALRDGIARMVATGELHEDADPERLGLALLAALQGGLLLGQATRSSDALEAALDSVIGQISSYAVHPGARDAR